MLVGTGVVVTPGMLPIFLESYANIPRGDADYEFYIGGVNCLVTPLADAADF